MSITFRVAAWNDKAGRSYNEDRFQVKVNLSKDEWGFMTDKYVDLDEKGALLVVCDGMGGMSAGDVAATIAVETIQLWFAPEQLTAQVTATPEAMMRHIERAIIAADENIKADGKRNKEREGMGSTIVLAWIKGEHVYVGW